MSILEKIKRKKGVNIQTEKLAEELVISFKEKKENGEEHPIDTTVEEIMNIFRENPDPIIVKELIKELLERKEIPNKIVSKVTPKILKKDEIPNVSQAIVEAVQETEAKVPTEVIDTIVDKGKEEGTLGIKARIGLIQSVEDKAIIEKHIKGELEILYNNCSDKRDGEVTERVKEITGLLEDSEVNVEIQNLIYNIVARKMAQNCYNKNFIRIYGLSQIMPVEDMMKKDLPSMVLKQYQIIEQKQGNREKRGFYNKVNLQKNIKEQILNEMARNIAQTYKKTELFVIPQSENMQKLTTEEEKRFIKEIQILSGNELLEKQVESILEEYPKIQEIREKDKDEDVTSFEDKRTLEASIRNYILDRLIDQKYDKEEMFVTPKLNKVRDLTSQEENMFIKKVKTLSKNMLLEKQIINIKAQIKGLDISQTKENMIISEIKELSKDDKNGSLDFLIELVGDIKDNNETQKTLLMLSNSGLIKRLNDMPDGKRQETIDIIGSSLKKTGKKLATEKLKVEGSPTVSIYLEDECK